ncbi:uncharacterized protein K441DRAFT_699583 [Cenococcum geophilum 1.58]|uniref:uncharacterized protein n=1 Tax=Cenococcum geophilum 1.58 TaxID=794803 RepID=UPI00358F5AA1|nr:hypothetical protein K441DRAFT_699583 [Cenococcum geophilum 1.58]
MRRHVRRALYPFREETLSKIQRVVSEARSNLYLALQVLQVGGISDIRYEVNLLVRWQKDFLEWAKGNKETVWCLGSPGVGKTVLAAIVRQLVERRQAIPGDVRTLYKKHRFCRLDSNLQNDILQVVVLKARGMFLAARLYVESLASKTNLRAVKKALRELPATLDDNYNETMERIKQQPTKILAMRALSWIVYAVRPLQLEEVLHAIAVDDLEPDDRSISEEILTPQSVIVNACAGMVKIDEERNVIGLVHKTTQEYLE